ncbi:MAG: hypothetical protein CVT70_14985 [Alphaproteobacteria bacterium HGW-Alphaproteobacteria-1]|nr:MAG: hypothetical protein CVT70_14985 [Alphaproteobacteria bacterium HGW-Alphaproteobacteria-1]
MLRLGPAIMNRYALEFTRAWTAALDNIRLRPMAAGAPQFLALNAVSDPRQSPILKLVEAVNNETRLTAGFAEEGGFGAGLGNLAEGEGAEIAGMVGEQVMRRIRERASGMSRIGFDVLEQRRRRSPAAGGQCRGAVRPLARSGDRPARRAARRCAAQGSAEHLPPDVDVHRRSGTDPGHARAGTGDAIGAAHAPRHAAAAATGADDPAGQRGIRGQCRQYLARGTQRAAQHRGVAGLRGAGAQQLPVRWARQSRPADGRVHPALRTWRGDRPLLQDRAGATCRHQRRGVALEARQPPGQPDVAGHAGAVPARGGDPRCLFPRRQRAAGF